LSIKPVTAPEAAVAGVPPMAVFPTTDERGDRTNSCGGSASELDDIGLKQQESASTEGGKLAVFNPSATTSRKKKKPPFLI
jgi:hypothetical protein